MARGLAVPCQAYATWPDTYPVSYIRYLSLASCSVALRVTHCRCLQQYARRAALYAGSTNLGRVRMDKRHARTPYAS